MPKLLFFDIDGTLVDFDAKMPESAKEALRRAQENGHKCFICSGRSYNQIYPDLLKMGFDGIVAAAGGYVEYQGKEICNEVFGSEIIGKVIELFDQTDAGLIMQMKDWCVSSKNWQDTFRKNFLKQFGQDIFSDRKAFKNLLINDELDTYPELCQNTESIVYCNSPYTVEELCDLLPPELKATLSSFKKPDPYSGEITLTHINKATGIQRVMELFGCVREDVIGFGDGPNDLDMMEFAGIGVAMGNAQQCVKEIADMVTDDIKQDGLYKAMEKLGLI